MCFSVCCWVCECVLRTQQHYDPGGVRSHIWNAFGKLLSALAKCLEEEHEIPFFVGCAVGGGEETFMAKP